MSQKELRKNLVLIGCGVHAKNTYFPFFKATGVSCSLVVDSIGSRNSVLDYLAKQGLENTNSFFVKPSSDPTMLVVEDEKWLDDFVAKNEIDGVIICTGGLS